MLLSLSLKIGVVVVVVVVVVPTAPLPESPPSDSSPLLLLPLSAPHRPNLSSRTPSSASRLDKSERRGGQEEEEEEEALVEGEGTSCGITPCGAPPTADDGTPVDDTEDESWSGP